MSRLLSCLTICLLVVGCASPKAYVVARKGTLPQGASANQTVVAVDASPKAEKEVGAEINAGLKARGFSIVPKEGAEFTLAYWVDIEKDDNVKTVPVRNYLGEQPVYGANGRVQSTEPVQPFVYEQRNFTEMTKWLRVRLYSNAAAKAGKFERVWEGGIKGSPGHFDKHRAAYVKALLDCYGKDQVGNVPLK